MGVSNKTPEFLKMNPIGKVWIFVPQQAFYNSPECNLSTALQVPVLETPDGPVFESNAIARYGEPNVAMFDVKSVVWTYFDLALNFVIFMKLLAWRLTTHFTDLHWLIMWVMFISIWDHLLFCFLTVLWFILFFVSGPHWTVDGLCCNRGRH